MTSSNIHYLPKAPTRNIITLEVRASIYEFEDKGHKHSIHNILLFHWKFSLYYPLPQNKANRGQPGGTVVKGAHSASVARGSPVHIQGADMAPCGKKAMLWQASHVYSGGRWAWMLAQGQSSSAKRGGLTVVSSGLIFLKKNKQIKQTNQM